MRTIQHPLSGATYDLLDDGTIRVVTRDGADRRLRQARPLAVGRRPAGRPPPVPVDRRQGAAQPVPAGRRRPEGTRPVRPRRGAHAMTITDRPPPARPAHPAPRYQDLLDADSRPENVPVVLRWQRNEHLGSADIPARALRQPRLPRAGEGEALEAGRGRWPAARRTSPRSATRSSTRSATCRSSSCARRPTRSRRSSTPASTAAASSRRRTATTTSCAARSTATAGTSTAR